MATYRLFNHSDFIGVRDDGICLWRRRAGPPPKREPPPVERPRAEQFNQQSSLNNSELSLADEDLQDFRVRWLVNRAFTHHSRAKVVASLIFGEG